MSPHALSWETSLGGHQEGFPETLWSSVLSSDDLEKRRERLTQLCLQYWRPVYRLLRVQWGKSIEEAKDLTQEFFAHLLSGDFISRYLPKQGQFRLFLRGALRTFMAETLRNGRALKRGGNCSTIPMDVSNVEVTAPHSGSPEEAFDREWAAELMSRCVGELKEEFLRAGDEDAWRVFEIYDLDSEDRRTYEEIARALQRSAHEIRAFLVKARSRLRELVEQSIQEYVTSRQELMDELSEFTRLFER